MHRTGDTKQGASFVNVEEAGCSFVMHLHPRSELVSDIIRERGRYSHNDLRIMRALINEGDFVVDIGANIGWYTLFFSAFVGAAGSVLAVEPERDNLVILRRNLLKNRIRNVEVFAGALSEVSGKGRLFLSRDNSGDHMLDMGSERSSARESAGVAIDTLDRLVVKRWKGKIPTFIKMDVQGSEPKILRGARTLFDQHRPVVMLEYSPDHIYRCGSSGFEIFAFIESRRYVPFRQLGDGEETPDGKLLEPLTPGALLHYHERLSASGLGIDLLLLPESRIAEVSPYIYNR